MQTLFALSLLFVWINICCFAQEIPGDILIGGLFPLTGRLSGGGVQRDSAARIAIEDVNSDDTILPDTRIEMISLDTGTSQAIGLTAFLEGVELGTDVIVGAASSSVSSIIAIAAGVFDVPQLSYSSTSAALSIEADYPLFGRMVPPDDQQGFAFANLISFYGWENFVSAISTSDDYGVGGVNQFIQRGADLGIEVISYQQFLPGDQDIQLEMKELSNSGARVFLAFLLGSDAQIVFEKAVEFEIVGDNYVWLCSDGCAQVSVFTNEDGEVDPLLLFATKGLIGLTPSGGKGEAFELFLDDWETRDPEEYPGAGSRSINLFAPHAYDCVYTFALTFDEMIKQNQPFNSDNIINTLRNLTFTGLTGEINFESNGDRLASYDVVNHRAGEDQFTIIGSWSAFFVENENNGFTFDEEIQFFDGTTNVPDLDVQPPFHYWDCHDKKMKYDETGKEIDRTTPDGDDPDFLSSHYRCDEFIDCDNMSDESFSCTPSYAATFVSFGIITGLLILTIPFFILFTIAFGIIWKKKRIIVLSPIFLIGMCVAAFLGYSSTFAWYGKANTVACNFQPWLLGISVNLMIAFLFAKTFRIWRIFKSPFVQTRISDLQLMILVLIIMIPCILILIAWTSFATPTATVREADGEDHYLCETGGLTGPPGGIIFFSILVAYTALILLFGVFLAFVTRNVPEEYSESKLVGYSVYNLAFLSAACIPIFFVLRYTNPVAAWIIRTIAILYGFTATLWFQFLPPMVLLVLYDKCRGQPPVKSDGLSMGESNSSSVNS